MGRCLQLLGTRTVLSIACRKKTHLVAVNIWAVIVLSLFSPLLKAAELAPQPVVFAYLANGAPVSSLGDVLEGFCGALRTYLDTHTKEYSFKNRALNSVDDRFGKFATSLAGKPGIQCGPDTKTRERTSALSDIGGAYVGEFSVPFAKTSIKLLLNKAAIEKVHSLKDEDLRIGVLKALEEHQTDGRCKPAGNEKSNTVVTTTLIGQVFHNSKVFECPDRDSELAALNAGVVDAIAGDEIILHNMHSFLPDRDNFFIYPPLYLDGFSHEHYVVTFFNLAGSPIIKLVNDWIEAPQGKEEAAKLQPQLSELEREMKMLLQEDNLGREQSRRDQVKREIGDSLSAFAAQKLETQQVLAECRWWQIFSFVLLAALVGSVAYVVAIRLGWSFKPRALLTDEQFDMAVRLADGLTQLQTLEALQAFDEKYKKLETSPFRVGNEMKKVRKIYGIQGEGLGNLRKYLKRDYPDKFAEYEKYKTAQGANKKPG